VIFYKKKIRIRGMFSFNISNFICILCYALSLRKQNFVSLHLVQSTLFEKNIVRKVLTMLIGCYGRLNKYFLISFLKRFTKIEKTAIKIIASSIMDSFVVIIPIPNLTTIKKAPIYKRVELKSFNHKGTSVLLNKLWFS